ncbi:VOC family protein [Variovorax sp. LT2P21]
MQNALSWFEIPVSDLDRAQTFYQTVLGQELQRQDFGGAPLAVFKYERPGVGGALQASAKESAPAGRSIRIYLSCTRLDAVLERIAPAGGAIVSPKEALPQGMGFIAHLRDTEGNAVGLHSLD